MFYFIISIFIVTIIFWGLHKGRIVTVCPICAGVLITWIGGIASLYYGASLGNPMIVAILMGASMGALADKYGARFGLLWKSAVVLIGLPAIYMLVQKSFWAGLGLVATIAVYTAYLHNTNKPKIERKKDLFKECC